MTGPEQVVKRSVLVQKGSITRLDAFATCHKREASFLPVQDDNHAVSHQGPEIVPVDDDYDDYDDYDDDDDDGGGGGYDPTG
ncbi:hypothetical protein M0802_010683 [Mischocyttarus mexicanus]|nr:hypothetical protein M0802_010683 [Mischocyttarus mexicanus]